jgi:uncharacterized protein YdcH (DUF465 family)
MSIEGYFASEEQFRRMLETLSRIEAKVDRISQEYRELDERLKKCERKLGLN